jgi:hypothetical protein
VGALLRRLDLRRREDTGSPVRADYASPSPFTGTVKKIVVDTIRSAEDRVRIGAE